MPVVSQAQNAAMHAAAQGSSTLGIPKSVGQDFVNASHGMSVKRLPFKKHAAAAKKAHEAGDTKTAMHHIGHMMQQARHGTVGLTSNQAPEPAPTDATSGNEQIADPGTGGGGAIMARRPEPKGLGNWMTGSSAPQAAPPRPVGATNARSAPNRKAIFAHLRGQ